MPSSPRQRQGASNRLHRIALRLTAQGASLARSRHAPSPCDSPCRVPSLRARCRLRGRGRRAPPRRGGARLATLSIRPRFRRIRAVSGRSATNRIASSRITGLGSARAAATMGMASSGSVGSSIAAACRRRIGIRVLQHRPDRRLPRVNRRGAQRLRGEQGHVGQRSGQRLVDPRPHRRVAERHQGARGAQRRIEAPGRDDRLQLRDQRLCAQFARDGGRRALQHRILEGERLAQGGHDVGCHGQPAKRVERAQAHGRPSPVAHAMRGRRPTPDRRDARARRAPATHRAWWPATPSRAPRAVRAPAHHPRVHAPRAPAPAVHSRAHRAAREARRAASRRSNG